MSEIKKKIKRRRKREEQAKKYRIALIATIIVCVVALVVGTISVKLVSSYIANKKYEKQQAEMLAEAEKNKQQVDAIVNTQKINAVKDKIEDDFNDSSIVEMTDEQYVDKTVNQIIENMTLEEKIYQMVITTPDDVFGKIGVVAMDGADIETFKTHPVGGFVFLEANLQNPIQTKGLLQQAQSLSDNSIGYAPFLCVNEEGGAVAPIANNGAFKEKRFESIDAIQSLDDAEDAGLIIGDYLNSLGFNVNFAPSADVNSNEEGSLFAGRTFGDDPYGVSSMSNTFAEGMKSKGVEPVYKYFPGTGTSSLEEESGKLMLYKNMDSLRQKELIPYANAIENGAEFIMVGNVFLPNVLGNDVPCSLSSEIVQKLLREEMGYQGLIITDALNNPAIVSDGMEASQIMVKAIEAGADLVLIPSDLERSVATVVQAVKEGTISEERINESIDRILRKKMSMAESFE